MADDIKQLEEFISQLPEKLKQVVEISLGRTGEAGVSKLSQLFKTEGKSLSVEWKDLNKKYLAYKIKKGFSEKKLHKTTTLAQSFDYKTSQGKVVIGTPVKYAVFHEKGTKKMPARPFMQPVANYLSEKAVSKIFRKTFREML